MFCMSCGKALPEGASFCAFCGTTVNRYSPPPKKSGSSIGPIIGGIVLGGVVLGGALIVLLAVGGYVATRPTDSATSTARTIPIIKPPSVDLAKGPMAVDPRGYKYIQFSVTQSSYQGIVVGKFTASGGSDDIDVLIVPADEFANFQNGHNFRQYFQSGYVTSRRLKVPLPPGNYYLVFNNTRALLTNKVVDAYIELRYE